MLMIPSSLLQRAKHFTEMPPIKVRRLALSDSMEDEVGNNKVGSLSLRCFFCHLDVDISDTACLIQREDSKLTSGIFRAVFGTKHDVSCVLDPEAMYLESEEQREEGPCAEEMRIAKEKRTLLGILSLMAFHFQSGSRTDLTYLQEKRWRFSRINCVKCNLFYRVRNNQEIPSPSYLAAILFHDDSLKEVTRFQVSIAEAIIRSIQESNEAPAE